MQVKHLMATVAGVVIGLHGAAAEPVVWAPADGGNGHVYEVCQLPGPDRTWEAARQAAAESTCGGVMGHLATITSPEENEFVAGLVGADPAGYYYWIGGHQPDPFSPPAAGWVWVTGEPWAYTNWAPDEPNDYGDGQESHLAMWGVTGREPVGTWNDEGYVIADGGYVVEYDLAWPDCNSNGVPDDQDLRDGTSLDLNDNGIPDECEATPGFVNLLAYEMVPPIFDRSPTGAIAHPAFDQPPLGARLLAWPDPCPGAMGMGCGSGDLTILPNHADPWAEK